MTGILVFFGSLVVLELLLLACIVWCWFWLEKTTSQLQGVEVTFQETIRKTLQQVRVAESLFKKAGHFSHYLTGNWPWWFKWCLKGTHWLQKHKMADG